MRMLPSGSTALLLELDDLDEVLGWHAALIADPPLGVVDVVPAARTVLIVIDPATTDLDALRRSVAALRPRPATSAGAPLLEIPVVYDGEDLGDVAELLECDVAEVVARHTATAWRVAFCGFMPGFGYLTTDPDAARSARHTWDLPRRRTPRTRVPPGAVALAGEFTGVYPRASPGGWQLVGRTELQVFDPAREPAALLAPGTPVRFVAVDAS
jgi:KipI family sensor histidine kinase inhibitor